MNRRFLWILLLLTSVLAVYFLFFRNSSGPDTPKDKPLAIGENTAGFNASFQELLKTYEVLKAGFTASDSNAVNAAAAAIIISADSLKTNEIQGDSTGSIKLLAIDLVSSLRASAEALQKEADLEAKRTEFKMISEYLWNLARVVQYKGVKLYYINCSSALNNNGGSWIAAQKERLNPYLGKETPDCANATDSIDYSKN